MTTSQSHILEWKEHGYGKLTCSMIPRAITVIRNHYSPKINHLRHEIYDPKILDHVPALKWGVAHESVSIDA